MAIFHSFLFVYQRLQVETTSLRAHQAATRKSANETCDSCFRAGGAGKHQNGFIWEQCHLHHPQS